MARGVKTTRQYNSPRRAEQAAVTRRTVLDAATELFTAEGYPSTTMAAIASRAGVSLKTAYVLFGTKSGLLRALWDLLLKGDQDVAPVANRAWYQEVLTEPDAERQLRLNARNARVVKERIGGILKVIRSAAPLDADSDALWQLIQSDFLANQRVIVESVNMKRALRPDLDVDRATDILWTLNHPDVWLLLVDARGWTPAQWESWFAETSCVQLLTQRTQTSR